MHSIKCSRCGKSIISSKPASLCVACENRKVNGKRLAAERNEERTYLREEERRYARQEFSDLFGVPIVEVPAYVGSASDPLYRK